MANKKRVKNTNTKPPTKPRMFSAREVASQLMSDGFIHRSMTEMYMAGVTSALIDAFTLFHPELTNGQIRCTMLRVTREGQETQTHLRTDEVASWIAKELEQKIKAGEVIDNCPELDAEEAYRKLKQEEMANEQRAEQPTGGEQEVSN